MNENYEMNSNLLLESLACGDPYLRRNFIGASDAPIIMGVSPWKSPLQLYREKAGINTQQQENRAMARGTHLEDEARKKFESIMLLEMPAKRLFSKTYEWMMASLDGFNDGSRTAVEIKCPGMAAHAMAMKGEIPEYYIPQLQHQMYVAELESIYYFSYMSENNHKIIECMRDDSYIEKMIEKELKFWDCIQNMVEPEMTDKDFEIKSDLSWVILSNEWKSVQRSKKKILEREEQIKKELIQCCDNRNCMGSGIVAQKITRKGAVDYEKIFEIKQIDLEKYRKESVEFWKISSVEEKEE